jgi:DNA polymerase III subunit gamma/tau
MTEHGALYRKYRPQAFAEVRDQEHIVKVLEGAIRKGEIPHALLFSGTRGTGKTTMARIFAKEIGTSGVDLYEIDAASNRGIDDIRELKEAVYTVPYESKYKVYIIDEVHMLTKEAFNALLKTLEEPPVHVIFILATTEEEKLLDTILSRCQVFRFRSPSRAVLATAVTDIAKQEGFALSPDAADLIAIAADGSFRDALGVTQKVILASGDTIGGADEVAAIIGAPRIATMRNLLSALAAQNTGAALEALNEAVTSHADMKLFARLLLESLRAVMLLRHQPDKADLLLAPFAPDTKATITALAADKTSPLNSHVLLRFIRATQEVLFSPLPQLPLEIAIIDTTTKV